MLTAYTCGRLWSRELIEIICFITYLILRSMSNCLFVSKHVCIILEPGIEELIEHPIYRLSTLMNIMITSYWPTG